jgi:hypothetical protein
LEEIHRESLKSQFLQMTDSTCPFILTIIIKCNLYLWNNKILSGCSMEIDKRFDK